MASSGQPLAGHFDSPTLTKQRSTPDSERQSRRPLSRGHRQTNATRSRGTQGQFDEVILEESDEDGQSQKWRSKRQILSDEMNMESGSGEEREESPRVRATTESGMDEEGEVTDRSRKRGGPELLDASTEGKVKELSKE